MNAPDLRPAPETRLTHITAMREEGQFTVAYPVEADRTFYLRFSVDDVAADQRVRLCMGATVEVTLWPELTPAQEEVRRAKGHRIAYGDGVALPDAEDSRIESVLPRPVTQGRIGATVLRMRAKRWERAKERMR